MYLERLFASAGKKIDSGLLNKIIDQLEPNVSVDEEGSENKKSSGQTKDQEKKIEARRAQMKSLTKDGFKRFAAAVKKNKFEAAVVELIELAYLIPELNGIANFHALLTLNYVALRKYYPAEQEEKNARRMDTYWDIFDEITDNAYESGVFFLAEYMRTSVNRFKEDKRIVEDLHWDEQNFKAIVEDLGVIFNLESDSIWKSYQEEGVKFDKFGAEATLEDLIIQMCQLFVLPFYSRLELGKIAGAAKLDDNNS